MDLTSKKNIKNLLQKYGTRPLKRLGQNFLINKSVLHKIVDSANLSKKDIVLEIGPGIGVLTQELAKRVKKVIAIEKDKKMVKILNETLKDFKNVEIIHGDILKIKNWKLIENCKLKIENFKVIANLPYYIVSPVIRKFLEVVEVKPLQMILMVQKEVVQRICAKPPKMSILAVSVQFYSKPEILFYVPKNSFWPQPKVDSAIIKIVPKEASTRPGLVVNKDLFFKIVKAGFSHPRKQIINNLSKELALSLPNEVKLDKEKVQKWLLKNGVKPTQRAETLNIRDWIKLTRNWYKI